MENCVIEAVKTFKGNDIQIIDIVTESEPFKFIKFGRKKFSRHNVIINNKGSKEKFSLIEKELPETDATMIFTNDKDLRELQFFNSPLKKSFERFFVIPVIHVDTESRKIFMEDCVQDLKTFGPPILPNLEQMKALITRIAIKDARLQKRTFDYAQEYLSSFALIKRMFNDTLTKEERSLISTDWPWFLPGSNKLIKHIGPYRYDKWRKMYETMSVEKVFSGIPFSYQHGDFYFANIGFKDTGKPVVLDWECLAWGPIGLDYVILTNGIPPLAFTDKYEEWYISAYNNACDDEITMKEFLRITDLIKKYYFLVADTIDAIRFSFHNEAGISSTEQNARIKNYIQRLDLYLKIPRSKGRSEDFISSMEI